VTQLCNKVQ